MFSRRPPISSYFTAVAAVAVVTGIRLALEIRDTEVRSPFLLFALPVLIAGIVGGMWPAILATALSVLIIDFLFLEPYFSLALADDSLLLSHLLFIIHGLIIAGLSEVYHRSVLEATTTREQLESRVEERTAQLASANYQLMNEVHERTLAEGALFVERNALTALLDSLQEGIIATDSDGNVVRYNDAARTMCGLTDPKPAPEDWQTKVRFLDPETNQPVEADDWPLRQVLRDGRIEERELILLRPDGSRRIVTVSGRVILDEGGRQSGAVISLHDVTDAYEARQRLNAAITELRRSNRELQDFASVASHDLQEPLRKIQAFGDRLKVTQGDRLDAQGTDYLSRMHNAAGRMQVLINDLLAFSRVTSRAQPFQRVDVGHIIQEVISDLETRIEESHGKIEVGPMPTIDADPTQIRQLFQNLLSNALKFRKPDVDPVVHITTVPNDNPNMVEIHVKDNGIGFDQKYADRIFNIFQRLHGRNQYEGTGVGLAACRKIVQRHGGQLTARSRPDEGTTFVVILPRSQPEVQHHAHAQTDHDSAGG